MNVVRAEKKIVTLEIEGMITDKRCQSLSTNLSNLFLLNDRVWKSISFVDSIAPEEFITWRGHKHAVANALAMSTATATNPLKEDKVEFRAVMDFPKGTSITVFLDALRSLSHHKLVRAVEFYGSLFQCEKSTVVAKLEESVDDEGYLTNNIKLEVICGLLENTQVCELVEMCLQKGREIKSRMKMDSSGSRRHSARSRGEDACQAPTGGAASMRPRGRLRARTRSPSATNRRIRTSTTSRSQDKPRPRRSSRRSQKEEEMSSPTSVTKICLEEENLNSSLPFLTPLAPPADQGISIAKAHQSVSDFGSLEKERTRSNERRPRQRTRTPRLATRRDSRARQSIKTESRGNLVL